MNNNWHERALKIFRSIRIFFERVLLILAVVLFGSALLSIYSFIHFVNIMASIYRGNTNTFVIAAAILIAIPLVSYVLEKGIASNLRHR